jgi:hypothetical protein
MIRYILCGLVAAVTIVISPALAGGSDPQVVLDEIYGQVDATCGGDGQGPAYDIYVIAEDYFTPDLAKTFTKAMETGDLGFDVLVDAQDCKVTDLKLEVVKSEADAAVGRATFKNMGEDRVIDLLMSKSGNGWSVDDIVYRHRTFSLRAGEG